MIVDETSVTTVQIVGKWLSETNIQAAIISPLFTGVGALIVLFFKRANDEKICIGKLVQDVEECAINHWCMSGAEAHKLNALKIQNLLQTLSWKIDQDKQKIRDSFIAYRQAVTSGDFDSTVRGAISVEDPRVELIRNKARELRKTLGIKKHH